MATFDLRLRLRLSPAIPSAAINAYLDQLESQSQVEDVTTPDESHAFVVWLTLEADQPRGALDAAASLLALAESAARRYTDTSDTQPMTQFVSAELEIPRSSSEVQPLLPA